MSSSKTEIANFALRHLGVGVVIANFETERSEEARACRTFFEIARDMVLGDFPWPFATKFADLALVESDPTTEWGYSYRYPSDCLRFRRILGASRNPTKAERVKFKIGQDSDGQLIYTDEASAVCEYTIQVEAVERYPAEFVLALSLILASLVAPSLSGGDPFKNGPKAAAAYQGMIISAQVKAITEEQPDDSPESEFITVR